MATDLIPLDSTRKNTHGGKRLGAGRKPSTETYFKEEVRAIEEDVARTVAEQFRGKLEGRLIKSFDVLASLADGLTPEQAKVFEVYPDRYANIYFIDRYLGKPTERVEGRGEVTIRIVYEKRPRIVDGKVHEEGI